MSKMSDLFQDILAMLEQGDRPAKIAAILDIPISMVYDALETQEQTDTLSPYQTINS